MAKVKFGAMVTDMRGKSNGNVYSKNRGGAYLRTKVTPVNRKSVAQLEVRDRLSSLSQSWRALTESQRIAWNSSVNDFKKTNVFGDLRTPSGFNLFQRLNNNSFTVGGAGLTTPPIPTSVDSFSDLVLTADASPSALSLAFTATAGEDNGYKVFATAPQSAGKSNLNSEYRLIAVGTTTPTSPLNILSAYTAKFGALGLEGQKIGVKIVGTGSTSGIEGVAASVVAVVMA
jgi:hypothetical protein